MNLLSKSLKFLKARDEFQDSRAHQLIIMFFIISYAVFWASYVPLYLFFLKNTNSAISCALFGIPSSLFGLYIALRHKKYFEGALCANFGGMAVLASIMLFTGNIESPLPAWFFFVTITTFLLNGLLSGITMTLLSCFVVLFVFLSNDLLPNAYGFEFALGSIQFKYYVVFVYMSSIFSLGIVVSIFSSIVKFTNAQLTRSRNKTQLLMDNMFQGICTIDGQMNAYSHSPFMKTIFGKDFDQLKNIKEFLLEKSTASEDDISQLVNCIFIAVGEDCELGFELNEHFLINEFVLKDGQNEKVLEVDWIPIVDDLNIVERFMVNIRDVTENRRLQLDIASKGEKIKVIEEVIQIGLDKFKVFEEKGRGYLDESTACVEDYSAKTSSSDALQLVDGVFRQLHTLKALARSYGFKIITNEIHLAEQECDKLRKYGQDKLKDMDCMEIVSSQIEKVNTKFQVYTSVISEIFAKDSQAGDKVAIDALLRSHEEYLDRILLSESGEIKKLAIDLVKFDSVYLKEIFKDVEASMTEVAANLHKEPPKVEYESDKIVFKKQCGALLEDVGAHLFRNSLDHGIENPDVREKSGKPAYGTVFIKSEQVNGQICIHFSDDGHGLNLRKLEEIGLKNGSLTAQPSDEDIAQVIFHSGVTVKEQATDISGRGVGMDAVKSFIEKNGGSIETVFVAERSSEGFRPIKFRIFLPLSFAWSVG